MSTLKQKAQQVLEEKINKIKPENIKKDTVAFGITGTLEKGEVSEKEFETIETQVTNIFEGEDLPETLTEQVEMIQTARDDMKEALENKGQSVNNNMNTYATAINNISGDISGAKIYKTVEEMNADTTAKNGDYAVVYESAILPSNKDTVFDKLIFPKEVVLPKKYSYGENMMSGEVIGADKTYYFYPYSYGPYSEDEEGSAQFSIQIYGRSGIEQFTIVEVSYKSSDGITFIRDDNRAIIQREDDNINLIEKGDTKILELNFKVRVSYGYNDAISYLMPIESGIFGGIYIYNDGWGYIPNQLTDANHVYKEKYFGKNGIVEGTLQNNKNLSREELKFKAQIFSDLAVLHITENYFGLSNTDIEYAPRIDAPNNTDISGLFENCKKLKEGPWIDMASKKRAGALFRGCESLESIPDYDFSNCTYLSYLFVDCKKLKEVSVVAPKAKEMTALFDGCEELVTIKELDASGNTSFLSSLCRNCKNLVNFPKANFGNVYHMLYAFTNCDKLSDESLENIIYSLAHAKGYVASDCKTLKLIGLSEEQAAKCITFDDWATLESNGWTTDY